MSGSEYWSGIPSNRIVAVEASLSTGKFQVGSGYLLTPNTAITARHCTYDKKTNGPAVAIRVICQSDGTQAPARVFAAALDIAVLTVGESASSAARVTLDLPSFGRVDATHSAELLGCEALGFPLWQLDSQRHHRYAAELHGTIRATEGAESGLLVMRDPLLWDVAVPDSVAGEDRTVDSQWGGLSGALVFYAGLGLGVVVEHHPRQGRSSLRILPIERIAALALKGDPDAEKVASALGLPSSGQLPLAGVTESTDSAVERVAIGLDLENPFQRRELQGRLS
jgi:hypothetical protein